MRIVVAAVVATAAYFSAAYYLNISYVPIVPSGENIVRLFGPYQRTEAGLIATPVWLPTNASRLAVYEHGQRIGRARAYDDPTRAHIAAGNRWNYVEFSAASDPNSNGRLYWLVIEAREGSMGATAGW
jgi:hypothetical protein